jgi:hypothetical protein
MSLSGFPEVKWIYIRSFGIVDSPEYKELVVPTPLLIQPDRQGFSYANPADRNRSPNAELSNHNFKFVGAAIWICGGKQCGNSMNRFWIFPCLNTRASWV